MIFHKRQERIRFMLHGEYNIVRNVRKSKVLCGRQCNKVIKNKEVLQ